MPFYSAGPKILSVMVRKPHILLFFSHVEQHYFELTTVMNHRTLHNFSFLQIFGPKY